MSSPQLTLGLSKNSLAPGWDTSASVHSDTWLNWLGTMEWTGSVPGGSGALGKPASATSFSFDLGDLAFTHIGSMAAGPGGSLMALNWNADGQAATLALKAAWNSIKNVEISSFDGSALTVRNFVDAWVHLDHDFGQTVVLEGAKRGEVTLGSGDDRVELGIDTNDVNGLGWTNTFVVGTGEGNDTLVTRASSYNAVGGLYDGRWTTVLADLGAGDDVVHGGFAAREVLNGGAGTDTLHLSTAMAQWSVATADGVTTLTNGTRTEVLTGFEQVVFADGTLSLVAPPAARPLADVYLSEVAGDASLGFKITSREENAGVGYGVTGIGDVNGDGLGDFGIFTASNKTYVVFGGHDIKAVNLDTLNGSSDAGYQITSNGAVGYHLSAAGDVNGDGLADLIVAAESDSTNGLASGGAYVVFGKDSGWTIDLAHIAAGDNTLGFKVLGQADWNYAGMGVGGGGDVNGDGLSDVVVGSPYNTTTGNYGEGAAYVVFGKESGTTVDLNDVASGSGGEGFKIVGTGQYSNAGFSVDITNDMNGDGLADVVVSTQGSTYLVFGKTDGALVKLTEIATGTSGKGFMVDGVGSGQSASAGDVNGDGTDDIVIGDIYANKAYVVFGKADGATVHASDLALETSRQGFVVTDSRTNDYLGVQATGAGDVNGDGLGDMILASYSGAAYVVFGKAGGGTVDVATLAADGNGFEIHLPEGSPAEAVNVSAAGDVNGDGFADLLVADPYADNYQGAAYVVYGAAWHV